MKRRICTSTTKILAALAVCMLASAARADDDHAYHDLTTLESTLELGFLFNSRNDFRFGDYTGLEDSGFEVLGNADIRRRSAYDAERPYYFRVRGMNLGLDSRYLEALFKMPGVFSIDFVLDEIPKLQSDSARTPYVNPGSGRLLLPPGWDAGSNGTPAEMSMLESSLQDFELSHQRRTLGAGASLVITDNLDFDASYRRQTKRGEKWTAGMIGNNGGDPRAVNIPEPIDYVFHTIDSHLRYANDTAQLQIQYYGSGFENERDRLQWQNPFDAASSYDPAATYPNLAQKGQMPDNWFHQGVVSGGVNLPLNSRLMVNTAFGWGRQDEDFLPYTLNPGFDNFANLPLPRNSLDGKVRTGLASFRLVSKPLPKLGVTVGYRWNERDNDSPKDTYFLVHSDAGNDGADPDQDLVGRINRPYSFEKHKVDVDLSYVILPRTKLTLSYDYEQIDRDRQEVDETSEHSYSAKLVTRPHPRISGGLRYQRAYRREHGYDCVEPLIATDPPAALTNPGCNLSLSPQFENHPDLRKFNQADRRRTDAHAWATFALLDTLSLGVNLKYSLDDYHDSELGLVERSTFLPGFDLSYAPTERVSLHAFYDYEKTRSVQDSLSFSNATNAMDPANGWSVQEENIFHTAGAGMEVVAIPDRLTLGMDYLFTRSREILDNRMNANLTDGFPFPDATTELHDVSLRGELQITRNLSLRLGYLYERFKSRDWAVDQVCVGCLPFSSRAAVLATGESAPDYSAHVGSLSVILHFW